MQPMQPTQAANIKMADLINKPRASGLQPTMVPAVLKNQVRVDSPTSHLLFTPIGVVNGAMQWSAQVQTPGVAKPLIMAKAEQQAMSKLQAPVMHAGKKHHAVAGFGASPEGCARFGYGFNPATRSCM